MRPEDEAVPARKSPALSVLLGLALFLVVLCLLVLSAGFDASKFIYVDF
ncbi:MAG TPA: hypothetical protein VK786_05685 [bacterium]|jgi:hypothetical protein|nr:hypothetical protein [bacterium]